MKLWSKLVSLFIILALTFSLAACGGTDEPDPTETPDGADPTEAPNGDETPQPTEKADLEFDMDGHVIRVAAWWDDLPSADATDESGMRAYQRMKQIEEQYNCTFEALQIPQDDISIQFDAAVLGDDIFAEIIYMRSENASNYANQGQLYPLSDVFDLSLPQFNQSISEQFTVDGKTYAFTTFQNNVESVIYFNKDIFERVGLAEPYELVKDKEWTWDKFVEYVDRATISSGSDEPEVYGFYGITTDPSISQVLASFGAEFVHRDESGLYSSGLSDDNTLAALNFLYELNTTNPGVYIPAEDAPWDDNRVMFESGKVAMAIGTSSEDSDMTDRFGIVPLPLAEGMNEYANVVQSHNVRVMHSSLDPVLAEQIAYVYTKLTASVVEDPDEDAALGRQILENKFHDADSVDIYLDLENGDSSIYNHYGASRNFWDILAKPLGEPLRGETTVASIIAAAEQAWEEDLARANEMNQ